MVFDEIERPKKAKTKINRNLDDCYDKAKLPENENRSIETPLANNATVIDISEGEQLIQMEVQACEENYFDSEESEGEEQSSTEEVPSMTDVEDSEHDSQKVTDNEELSQERATKSNQHAAMRQKIAQIDEEMSQKLNQLKEMMIQSGLTESVEVLNSCIQLNQNPKQGTQFLNQDKDITNKNTNASVKKIHKRPDQTKVSHPSQSIETIYKNAVQKRVSSSSDKMDTSDEFVHALSFSNQFLDGATVGKEDVLPSTSGYDPNRRGETF